MPTQRRRSLGSDLRFSACSVGSTIVVALLLALVGSVAIAAEHHNPAADGFNAEASDEQAMALADQVMDAMGGREAWDRTRYLSWNFFGRRTHLWDKWTGDLRFQQGERLVLMNINSREGRAFDGGEELSGEDLASALKAGYEAWVNDSYWLLMPYKLKDSGVTLRYLGDGEMEDGRAAEMVQLTFEDVGVTPENKYHVFIAEDSGLVEQWSFFAKSDDETPGFSTPWADWQEYGDILLSGDRGRAQLSEIAVYSEVPGAAFEDPAEPDRSGWN